MRRRLMGGLDIFLACVLLAAVWLALPVRWWPMDGGMTLLALGFLTAGVGLYRGEKWAPRVARWVAGLSLATGLILCTTLALTAGSLAGLYGPVGKGGAIILTVSAFLVLPYFVIFPAAQLYFLLPGRADSDSDPDSDSDSGANSDSESGKGTGTGR